MTDTPTPLTDAVLDEYRLLKSPTLHYPAEQALTALARNLERRLAEVQKRHEASHAEVLRLAEKLRKVDPTFNSPMHLNAAAPEDKP